MASTTSLTLEATAGAIEAEGKLTFQAGSGIRITQDLLSQQAISFPLVIDSDFDSEGDGSLTVSEAKAIDSNNSDITVTAWDLDLLGFIRAGAGNVCIHGSKPSQTIGVGATNKDMHMTDGELQRITVNGGLRIGAGTAGSITVSNITSVGSATLKPVVSFGK